MKQKTGLYGAWCIFSVILFIFGLSIAQYFIWSDLFVQEFDADVAESVIWAQAAVESGKLVNPDFYYTHLLPFGGQIIFIPIVRHFGVTLYALRLGMSICSALFGLVLAGFFYALGWEFPGALTSAGLMLLFLSGTKRLRDIFWSHVVHYNLSLFYLLTAFIFLSLLLRKDRKKHLIGLIGLEVSLILGTTNDIAVVLFFPITLFCAAALEQFLDGGIRGFFRKEKITFLAEIAGGIIAGFVLRYILTAHASTAYAEIFSNLSPAESWTSNLSMFLRHWVSMFTVLPEQQVPIFSSVGIKLMIRIVLALLVIAVSVRSFFVYRTVSSRPERMFLCAHWVICAEILFFFVFGVISNMNWRIIPMFFTSLVTALIILKADFSSFSDRGPAAQLLDLGTALFTAVYAAICCVTVFHQSISTASWFGQKTILKTLADHSLTYGYNLDYWFGNSITVLTDDRIKVREVILRNGKLSPSYHQSNIHWYEDQPGIDRYFLVCQEDEYWAHPEFAEGAIEIYRADQERTFVDGEVGFFIFVYDHNIFTNEDGVFDTVFGKNADQ